MSLSPSGREGLLSSCPTGGGQGRSLMTFMSTGASSRREKRKETVAETEREAEVETPKCRGKIHSSLGRRRGRGRGNTGGGTGLRGLAGPGLTPPLPGKGKVGILSGKQEGAGSCWIGPDLSLLTSFRGPRGPGEWKHGNRSCPHLPGPHPVP